MEFVRNDSGIEFLELKTKKTNCKRNTFAALSVSTAGVIIASVNLYCGGALIISSIVSLILLQFKQSVFKYSFSLDGVFKHYTIGEKTCITKIANIEQVTTIRIFQKENNSRSNNTLYDYFLDVYFDHNRPIKIKCEGQHEQLKALEALCTLKNNLQTPKSNLALEALAGAVDYMS